ncbi:hypothetical protein L2E82_44113 [Cichorium intybus]|uniref:Uncharacterized protein n=1 Tax=Cichorium intybus TaxID=13427 RepID=A0ACB8ZNV3_CICIN|nr:hypothetical protein L2E82_44113 [Cichorium intybus]
MTPRSTNFIFFTCLIFLPSIILMIINQCDGFSTQCNGNMTECPSLMADDEEFLMDTEEHRRLLGQQIPIVYPALQKPSICSKCSGLYDVNKDRGCTNSNYCNKGP